MKEPRRPSSSLMRISRTFSRVPPFFSRLTTAKCVPLNNMIKLHPKYLISTILVPIIRPWFISSALHKIREIYRFQKVRIHLLGDLIIQIMRVLTPITWKNVIIETTEWTRASWCFSLLLRAWHWTVISNISRYFSPVVVSNRVLISKICMGRICPSSLIQTSVTPNPWQAQTPGALPTTRVKLCQKPCKGQPHIRMSLTNTWDSTNCR